MKIHLNGENHRVKAETLMELVLEKGFNPESLIAEVNGGVIPQEHWKKTLIREQDTIELLNFVGGG